MRDALNDVLRLIRDGNEHQEDLISDKIINDRLISEGQPPMSPRNVRDTAYDRLISGVKK